LTIEIKMQPSQSLLFLSYLIHLLERAIRTLQKHTYKPVIQLEQYICPVSASPGLLFVWSWKLAHQLLLPGKCSQQFWFFYAFQFST